jgi:DNA invertase Pin-like site-specific DNA recombinase
MPATVVDIYTRTATEDAETLTKLEQQETVCRAYCEAHGLTVSLVHREVASGAAYQERERLSLMRSRYRDRLIQGVVVSDLYRLSRSHADLTYLLQEMKTTGITLYCVNTDEVMERMLTILGL